MRRVRQAPAPGPDGQYDIKSTDLLCYVLGEQLRQQQTQLVLLPTDAQIAELKRTTSTTSSAPSTFEQYISYLKTVLAEGIIPYIVDGDKKAGLLLYVDANTTVGDASVLFAQPEYHDCMMDLNHLVLVVNNICINLENFNEPLFNEVIKIYARTQCPVSFPLRLHFGSKLDMMFIEHDTEPQRATIAEAVYSGILGCWHPSSSKEKGNPLREAEFGSYFKNLESWNRFSSSDNMLDNIEMIYQLVYGGKGSIVNQDITVGDHPALVAFNLKTPISLLCKIQSSDGRLPTSIVIHGVSYPLSFYFEHHVLSHLGFKGAIARLSFADMKPPPSPIDTLTSTVAGLLSKSPTSTDFWSSRTESSIKPIHLDEGAALEFPSSFEPSDFVVSKEEGWDKTDGCLQLVPHLKAKEAPSLKCWMCLNSLLSAAKETRCCRELLCYNCAPQWNKHGCCFSCRSTTPNAPIPSPSANRLLEEPPKKPSGTLANHLARRLATDLACMQCHKPIHGAICCSKCPLLVCARCAREWSNCPRCAGYVSQAPGVETFIKDVREAVLESQEQAKRFPTFTWSKTPTPQYGSLQENQQRSSAVYSVKPVGSDHIVFNDGYGPLLKIDEPPEFFSARSKAIAYFNKKDDCWSPEVRFDTPSLSSKIEARLPHFSIFTVQNQAMQNVVHMNTKFFAPQWNFDFRDIDDEKMVFTRGPRPYKRPTGWYRHAVDVASKYPDELWLGSGSGDEVWPVAFHGTKTANIQKILQGGLAAGGANTAVPIANGAVWGPGIYVSPDASFAETYGKNNSIALENCMVNLVFQVRVRNGGISPKTDTIWVITDPQDVRVYGMCLKIVYSSKTFVTTRFRTLFSMFSL